VTVEGDQQVRGEQDLAPSGQLHPGLRHGDPRCHPTRRPEPRSDGEHLLGPESRERGDRGRVGARIVAADGDHVCPSYLRRGDRGERRRIADAWVHEPCDVVGGRGGLRSRQQGRSVTTRMPGS
jgi:hypothetical protein